ncbi:MAG TPA: flagellar hook-length control protein FliK [Candidatus Aquicultor sp.]
MNILDIQMTQTLIAQTQGSGGTGSTQTGEGDVFSALFGDIVAQLQGGLPGSGQNASLMSILAGLSNQGNLTQQTQLLSAGAGQLAGLTSTELNGLNSMSGLLAMLGQKLAGMMSQLLAGNQQTGTTAATISDMAPLLDTIISSLSTPQSSQADTMLAKLFVEVKELLKDGGLQDGLKGLAENLPEELKLKISLQSSDTNALSKDDLNLLYSKLIADLLAVAQSQSVNADSGPTTALGTNQETLTGLIMAKLGALQGVITPTTGGDMANTAQPKASQAVTSDVITGGEPGGIVLQQPVATDAGMNDAQAGTSDAKPSSEQTAPAAQHAGAKRTLSDFGMQAQAARDKAHADAPQGSAAGDTDKVAETTVKQPLYSVTTTDVSSAAGLADSSTSAVSNTQKPAFVQMVNPDQILKQIIEKFDVLVADGRSEARIELKPKYLGELKIHLIMEGGAMKAYLEAPSHQIKQILEANLSSLKQTLENQGLQVQDFDVSVGQERSGNNQPFGQFNRRSGNGMVEQVSTVREAQSVQAAYNLDGLRAVNYLA